MAVTPLLLIDVDGVLAPPVSARPGPEYSRHVLRSERLWLACQHGRWLTELAGAFELAWATAWEHAANQLIAPAIGLPGRLPVIALPRGRRMRLCGFDGIWKRPDVEAAVQDRPLAWLDDQFGPADLAWAERRTAAGVPTLLLACDPVVGLTRVHVDAALAWVSSLQHLEDAQAAPVAS
jgi:hypothetical protein